MEGDLNHILGNRGRHRHDVPDTQLLEQEQKRQIHEDLELLHGPAEVGYDKDELVVLVVLRDGISYIKSFVEHYFELGATHLVLLDNGSEDGTIDALKQYDNGVTVFKTSLPFKNYQISMRQYLAERFGANRWTLSVDIDELFDYPFSDVVSLNALLDYLNQNHYTAVVANMLDMFPAEISSETAAIDSDEPLKEQHRYYNTSNVTAFDYAPAAEIVDNKVSNEEIKLLQGGVQRQLFTISPLLSKHPLVLLEDGVKAADMSEHWVSGARLADFTGLLKHYKLSASLYGLVRREIEQRTYPNRHGKYDKYLKVLEDNPKLSLLDESSKELQSTDDLLSSGFMVVSESYMSLVERETAQKNGSEDLPRRFAKALVRSNSEGRRMAKGDADLLVRRAENKAECAEYRAERLRERTGRLDERVARLQQQKQRLNNRLQRAERKVQQAEEQAQGVERQLQVEQERATKLDLQIQAIESSKAWKMVRILDRVKSALRRLMRR